jgi:hypothetical protein
LNSTFIFFKILTLNRNINNVCVGLFLTVHNVFDQFLVRKIAFGLLNPNPLECLRHLHPFLSY